jgi:hypothetical protein
MRPPSFIGVQMIKSLDNYVIKETCKYCAQRLPFNLEHFAMCNECHLIFCSVKCVKECRLCGKNVCPPCSEEISRKYRVYGHYCSDCAQKLKYMFQRR